MDRAEIVHENFLRLVDEGKFPPALSKLNLEDSKLTADQLVEIFHAQVQSRHLDRIARTLQARGDGYYSIGSSGHEGCAAVAYALKPTDPAFLHYRDGAFQTARSTQIPGTTPVWDILLSLTCSSEDPISGGRHKVLGSKPLNIPPQTSTIASHLPKSVGVAYSIGLSARNPQNFQEWDTSSIVLCSFGDSSLNHSTAQGALNTASWTSYQSVPLPILFLCEDNGIGISTKTPHGWITASVINRCGIQYEYCNGLDVLETFSQATKLSNWVRERRKPAFLHMNCVRLYGHAGADIQSTYLSAEEIEATENDDPLLHSARHLIEHTGMSTDEVLKIYHDTWGRVMRSAEMAVKRPKLKTSQDVMASIIPHSRELPATNVPSQKLRSKVFGTADCRAMRTPQNMAKLINFALTDLMLEYPEIILAGEDIGRKGGVYGVSQNLQKRFGADRVIDTLLDEQSILGLAIGLGQNGFLPIPEIQFLAYLHNAEDQLRGEAATLSFFSNRQYSNPMVVRIAGLGYQHGFGGHFHNDNSLAVLRDIPGLIVACPSNGLDAVLMLRESVRLAREEQRVVAFIEPIALYRTRDLILESDGSWLNTYPTPRENLQIGFGEVTTHGNGTDVAIVTYGNGCHLSLKSKQELLDKYNVSSRVIDIRWLAPISYESIKKETNQCEYILIVDECRQTGSPSESLVANFLKQGVTKIDRVTAHDSFIATGPAYAATLPSVPNIIKATRKLLNA